MTLLDLEPQDNYGNIEFGKFAFCPGGQFPSAQLSTSDCRKFMANRIVTSYDVHNSRVAHMEFP